MNRFDITYFCGPSADYIVKEEIIADIAKSGMTLVPLGCDAETNKKALPLLARYGLNALVSDPRIYDIYNARNIEGADAMIKEITEDYKPYNNIVGWDIVDEPNAAAFPVLAAIVAAFRKYTPDKETVINLFPNYASPEQLGNPDYRTHLEEFVQTVNPHLISYDHYHFLGRDNRNAIMSDDIDEREKLIRLSAETTENRGGFFENIEVVREVGLKYNIDPMLIVLLTEHGPYRNLTYGELSWEVNMCIAYGMRRISYFTYWEPSHDDFWRWTNAMCDRKGIRYQHWFDVQKINMSAVEAGRALFGHKSLAVYHIGTPEPGTSEFAAFGPISSIEGENGVIGFFEGKMAYLVNRDFLSDNSFTIHSDIPLSCGSEVTLKPGEALLIKW